MIVSSDNVFGNVNSFQSLGAVDGPGLRCVVFMQGCPLHCGYCHNPETQDFFGESQRLSAQTVAEKVLRFKEYFGQKGGITVSGGEPFAQPEFVCALFGELKKFGVNCAADTSGAVISDKVKFAISKTDLIICDLKFASNYEYNEFCGGSLNDVLKFLNYVDNSNIPIWIRHTVIPTLTDNAEYINRLYSISKSFKCLEKFEILPFKKICAAKYAAQNKIFLFEKYPSCSEKEIMRLKNELNLI